MSVTGKLGILSAIAAATVGMHHTSPLGRHHSDASYSYGSLVGKVSLDKPIYKKRQSKKAKIDPKNRFSYKNLKKKSFV